MSRIKLFYGVLFWPGVLLAVNMPAYANSSNNKSFKQLKDDELRAVFNEAMIIGEYRNLREATKTYNYTEYHYADGTTDYKEGAQKLKGVWKIIGGDKICYKYPKSKIYTRTYCFFVYANDKCYYQYSPYAMTLKGPRDWGRWTSRAIKKGEGGSCDEAIG